MKRTSLWTGRSVGLIVSALGLAAVAVGTALLTQAAVGQAAGESEPPLARRDVSELLVAARKAISEGRLDDAEKAVARAESARFEYSLFDPRDTPKKVRKALEEARAATGQPGRPALPAQPPVAGGAIAGQPADPFASRDRQAPGGFHDGTALPSPNSYPTTLPEHVTMPTPPPIDAPFGQRYQQQFAGAMTGQPLAVAGRQLPQTEAPGLAQLAIGEVPLAAAGNVLPQSAADPAALAASMSALRSSRLALAVGDTRRARGQLEQAKSLGAAYPPGQDRPEAVEASIVRLEELMADRQAHGGDPAWRRQYGMILCEQAAALVDYRALDEAERLVADAARMNVNYGPYDINPQQVMQKIAQARQTGQPQVPIAETLYTPEQGVASVAPMPAAKEQALRLLAAARAALAAGDLRQADELMAQATALGVPVEQFAPGEDQPSLVAIDIQKAKMARAQRQAETPGGALSSERPQLALEVQQSLYSPETDTTANVPVAGNQPDYRQPLLAQDVPTPAPLGASSAAPVESEAARLLNEGETALRSGDTQTALQLFQSAYEQRGELDPLAAQRLQGHLQMLSTNAPQQQPASGGSLIDAASQTEQVLIRQLSADLTQSQTEARRLRETDPKAALKLLQDARDKIDGASLSQAVKSQLLRRVELSISDTDDYIAQNRAQLELDETNRQILEEVERRRQARLAMQQRIAELVDEFNKLQDEQRYDEMEIVAQRLYELAPEEQVAQMAWTTAKAYRRSKLNNMLQTEKEEGFWTEMHAVERSLIPFDDSNPFQYGDAHTWEQLTKSRSEQLERRNRLNERELEIQRKLRMPVQVDYADTPLVEVMNDLGRMTGITIHLDQYGLAQENVRTDQPVRLTVQNEISLKSVLDLILEPLHLDYVIQSEVLKITSQQRAQGATFQKVYDVADLVIPIPNFVPSNNMGLQGLINDAHMTAAGHWLSGSGPVSFVHNDRTKGSGKTLASEVMAQQGLTGASSLSTPTVPITSGPGGLGGGTQADFESLITLITTTVHADSWDFAGGPGSIKEFPTNLSLVISQTQEVHEEIADLLEQLRRLQDLQVTIEVRFITLSDNFFEQIGVDFDFLVEDGPGTIPELAPNPATGAPTPGQRVEGRHRSATVGLLPSTTLNDFPNFTADLDVPFTQESFGLISPQFGTPVNVAQFGFAILSDLEAYFVIQAAQGDRRSNVLEAPKVTLFNGQTAFVNDTASRPFVVSVIPVVGDFAAAQQPVIVVLSEGTMLSIQAVVSEDRRYVRMTVVPFFTQIGDVEEFTFEGSTTTTTGSSATDDDDDGNNEEETNNNNTVRSGTTVQLPTFEQISVSTTVSVPDGGTVLLGGIKRLAEGRNEFGVPLLSKIPYVNRLFRNVGIGRQTQSLMMMVTPRIIIQEEEEARLLGTQQP